MVLTCRQNEITQSGAGNQENFRNKLIWQGVFIMLQGTGWSDKNRSWQIDYLLENGTLRWYSEMTGGVWSVFRVGAGWLRGNEVIKSFLEQSFCYFIKHRAGLRLSPVTPVAVRRLCQCTSGLTFCSLVLLPLDTIMVSACFQPFHTLSPGPLLCLSFSPKCGQRGWGALRGDFSQSAQLQFVSPLSHLPYVFIPAKHPGV